MSKKENRKGFALGAIFALVASLFTAALPASAAATDGANIAVRPEAGPTTVFGGLLTEDFAIYAQLLPGQTNNAFATTSAGVSELLWEATETTGLYDLIVATDIVSSIEISASTTSRTTSDVVTYEDGPAATSWSDQPLIDAGNVAYSNDTETDSAAVSVSSDVGGGKSYFAVRAVSSSAITSESPNAVVNVTVWIDEVGGTNGVRDADEWFTTKTITLYSTGNVSVAHTVTGVSEAATYLTISSVVSGLNFQNLGGSYFLYAEEGDGDDATISSLVTATQLYERSGVLTTSTELLGGLAEGRPISVSAYYSADGNGTTTASSFVLGSWYGATAGSGGASAVVVEMDNDELNVTGSASTKKVRLNNTFTVKVGATTNSGATSVSGQAATVAMTGPNLVQYAKEISINGGAFTSSLPTAIAVTTGADGWGTFTYTTRGFVDGDDITITATSGNRTGTLTVEAEAETYTVHNAYSYYQTAPGTAVNVAYTVNDQWNVLSSGNHKLVITRGGSGFNYAATVSELLVSAGRATLAFTPESATATGSATIAAVGYVTDSNGSYVTTGMNNDGNVTVVVTSTANSFTTGLAGSYSTSVSYFPSTLSWVAMGGNASNTGSPVAVSGTGVIFKDASGATASGAMTVRVAADLSYTVDATATAPGTYTVTFTNGAASTTSLLIVDGVGSDNGVRVIWDTTAIDAGKTKIVTGKLVDANGNGVYTDNVGAVDNTGATTASILVTYAGTAGIPVGTMPTETDADGNFKVSILTSAADQGEFTLTMVYSKDGTATATADKMTFVQTITVGTAAASSSDKKVNAGSFKGYVALYAKGYKGQRMSAKVGNDWVVVESLASNFERVVEYTGAGYTIAVRIYIDRVLIDTITVTTK